MSTILPIVQSNNTQNGCKDDIFFRNSKEKQTQNRKRRQISENCKLRITNCSPRPAKLRQILLFSPFFYGFFPHHKMPSFLRSFSIAAPSLLHRFDGQSMDYRWITDGLSQEEEHRYNSALALKKADLKTILFLNLRNKVFGIKAEHLYFCVYTCFMVDFSYIIIKYLIKNDYFFLM